MQPLEGETEAWRRGELPVHGPRVERYLTTFSWCLAVLCAQHGSVLPFANQGAPPSLTGQVPDGWWLSWVHWPQHPWSWLGAGRGWSEQGLFPPHRSAFT